ncbi:MAG TPA: DUF5989 family protein [Kofleriaceae bacterium]|nr:DUF5989 family protein [Kofleriaceae bacterium]
MGDAKRTDEADELAELASTGQQGFVREIFAMLRENKKWWLTPIIIVLLLVGILVILGGTGAAPFIYTVF